MYKIAVLGDKESVLGFKALGLDIFPCERTEAKETLHNLAKQNYAIIYITEQIAKEIKPEIDEYKDRLTPAIILIPSKEGSLGIGMDNVRICVERAVGADILDK
jgi:V/A-type H+/Na+-transporting ATPase subunit F